MVSSSNSTSLAERSAGQDSSTKNSKSSQRDSSKVQSPATLSIRVNLETSTANALKLQSSSSAVAPATVPDENPIGWNQKHKQPPKSFTLFPKLPIEIRLKIWEQCHKALSYSTIATISCSEGKENPKRSASPTPTIVDKFYSASL
jgi:hypothetical protein